MKLAEKKIKKTIPFTIASKRMKYVGINLTKKARDIHWKQQNVAERNWVQINGKTSHVHLGEDSVLKMSILPKV